MAGEDGVKQLDLGIIDRSIVDVPKATSPFPTTSVDILWLAAQAADEIQPWGRSPKLRDRELRAFVPTESFFSSALGIVTAQNAAFSWKLDGPPRVVKRFQQVLETADFGEGWQDFISKVSIDLYTQDHGAFVELVRSADSPTSPVIALNHLDAANCYHTGDPLHPVIYQDRKNQYHLLSWWNVITLAEMPMPFERLPGLQLCALSRLMRAAQVIRNITIYKQEKTAGRQHRAIHMIKGITSSQIQDALDQYRVHADSRGLMRYVDPLIVGSVDPKADIGHDTLELASLPDGFDEETTFKQYIAQIAMAFLRDYQDFAPLPGGGLGTSAQSQILHLKSRGKGPAIFMKLISHALNFKVLPKNVQFTFDEQDIEADQQQAAVKKLRAEERMIRVQSGELTPEAARQLAYDSGDLPKEVFEAMGGFDLTPNIVVEDEEQVQETPEPEQERLVEGEKQDRAAFEEERLEDEADFSKAIEEAFAVTQKAVLKKLREEQRGITRLF